MPSLLPANIRAVLRAVVWPVTVYVATTLIVVMGVFAFGTGPTAGSRWSDAEDLWHHLAMGGDGYHFVEIARDGYSYDSKARSSVAFFPMHPLTGRAVAAVTRLSVENALLLTSNAYLLGAFILLALYARQRFGNVAANATSYTMLAFGLFPTTFFFRLNYSESSFLFFAILAMLAIEREWPTVVAAFIVGVATATRPVGVALVSVFFMSVWQRSVGWRQFTFRSLFLLPLALWGLIAYMAYQSWAFGQPLAFALTQEHWSFRQPEPLGDKVMAVLSHEPIWLVYDPSSEAFWQVTQPEPRTWSNLALANPLYFLLAVGLVIAGKWNRWLNSKETLLAALLILIPYLTRGFEMCMHSQGRFVAAAFPVYLVLGRVLAGSPAPCAALVLCLSAVAMAVYAALFAAGYMLI